LNENNAQIKKNSLRNLPYQLG